MVFEAMGAVDAGDWLRSGAVWRPSPGKRGAFLHQALVDQPGPQVRRLGETRAGEMRITRWLRNRSVTVEEISRHAAEATWGRAAGRHVVAIQDRTELALRDRQSRGDYGALGNGHSFGLSLHPVLAVEAGTGGLLGLVSVAIWNRRGKVKAHRGRATADKESQRWIDGTVRAGEVLAQAASVTMVSDRESDFYELLARRPENVQLIVRACQNRKIEVADKQFAKLFGLIDSQAEQGRYGVTIPAAPGRSARDTELALRFASVSVCRPLHGADPDLPKTLALTLVDVRETTPPADGKPVHWRLLTSHSVQNIEEARVVVDLYRQRWGIEEFFRTLKTAGFDLEAAEIDDPQAMARFAAAATVAAVTVRQLVQARDGTTDQTIGVALEPDDQPILEAVSAKLEGKTQRQRNPHPKGSLAFAAWVLARLGGWSGYYGKPGPKVMRIGLARFQAIAFGAKLRLQDV